MFGDERVMGDQDDRPSGPVQTLEEGEDFQPGPAIDRSRRFIREQQKRIVDDGPMTSSGSSVPLSSSAPTRASAKSPSMGRSGLKSLKKTPSALVCSLRFKARLGGQAVAPS